MPRGIPNPPLAVYECPFPRCKGRVELFVRLSPGYEPTCNGERRHVSTVMIEVEYEPGET